MKTKALFQLQFGIIILLLVVLSILAFMMLSNQKSLIESETNRYKSYVVAEELRESSQKLTEYCRTYVSTGDDKWQRAYWEVLDIRNGKKERPDGRLIALRDIMKELGFTEQEFEKLDEAERNSNGLVYTETVAFNAMKGLYDDGKGNFTVSAAPDTALARRIVFDDVYHAEQAKIMKPIDDFFKLLDARTAEIVEEDTQLGNILLYTIIGLVIAITLITLAAYNRINANIIVALGGEPDEIRNLAEKIAKGDLTSVFEDRTNRADIYSSMKNMSHSLTEIIGTITSTANHILSASGQISSTSQLMSQGANEQASSIEEVSSLMEEMVSNIEQNTDNAQQTEKIANQAGVQILNGGKAVQETTDSMKTIASKVSIIREIAFQTNILALNAAVEAARAGEHGKGFAVVAAEVRKLAERSQMAAKEIDEITKSSVDTAERTGKMFLEIVPSIQNTAKLVQQITTSSIEQNNGANQVNIAIQQLNQVAQQNAAGSEELATSAEEMSSQAEQLKDMVNFFKLSKDTRFA